MDQVLNSSTTDREFNVLLLGSFAALAVILAAVGLYGVLSYAVSQRRGEIGIRMALGANASEVSAWVLKQGMKPAIAGVVAGVAGALLLSRVLKSLLFGVTPLDPLTFIVVPVVLLAISALASYLPAVRAARVDPTSSLRSE
jgi:putative ABC transport system permease protein